MGRRLKTSVGAIVKHALAAGLALLLAGCFESEPAVIAEHDLATPPDLAGRYWRIEDHGIGSMTFRKGAQGTFLMSADKDEPSPVRLVSLVPPDLFLLVNDVRNEEGKPRSVYYLMLRIESGAWKLLDFNVNAIAPFTEANEDFLKRIASRHGFSLDPDDSLTGIEGPVRQGKIPQLFRDREFLAATRINGMATYLPANRSGEIPVDVPNSSDFEVSREIVLGSPLPTDAVLADPPGLAGLYYQAMPHMSEALQACRIRRMDDGRFLISGYGSFDTIVALLPYSADESVFLAVARQQVVNAEGKPDNTERVMLLTRLPNGWQFSPLAVGVQSYVSELSSVLQRMMTDAADRHGFTLSEATLTGPVDAGSLVSLFQDGQFTSGLRSEATLSMVITSEDYARQMFSQLEMSTP
ncbi:hypothetical protein [Novosphingobium malaysiense]|uniref:Lipoprotein n=1 Tax=Novosphingobium malaysiense TaxID=1348853 RepID=A0A0B1ZQJ3_9SPHN|nr:hypothetical protein [Novosphingobium malaysiense]KHK92866.1 hypothetical protein LK12_00100 [Novosphingobium malaysiense]